MIFNCYKLFSVYKFVFRLFLGNFFDTIVIKFFKEYNMVDCIESFSNLSVLKCFQILIKDCCLQSSFVGRSKLNRKSKKKFPSWNLYNIFRIKSISCCVYYLCYIIQKWNRFVIVRTKARFTLLELPFYLSLNWNNLSNHNTIEECSVSKRFV